MAVVPVLDYLKAPLPVAPVSVVFGEDAFLQRQVLQVWSRLLFGSAEQGGEGGAEPDPGAVDLCTQEFQGNTADLAQVLDGLATRSLFGPSRRLLIIQEADPFVSKHRPALEKYAAHPQPRSVLALVVRTWPSTTRLYKQVASDGLSVDCKVPSGEKLLGWLRGWSESQFKTKLLREAGELLLESVGPEPGLLHQELAKLSLVAGSTGITTEIVERFAGGWRVKTVWSMLDTALQGRSAEALAELGKLIESGEAPIAILAQVSSSLRKLHAATRHLERSEVVGPKVPLRSALQAVGVKPFVLEKSEQQLRHLGRRRAGQLGALLLQCDLALKGPSSAPVRARQALETFVLTLSAPQVSL